MLRCGVTSSCLWPLRTLMVPSMLMWTTASTHHWAPNSSSLDHGGLLEQGGGRHKAGWMLLWLLWLMGNVQLACNKQGSAYGVVWHTEDR
jgi:hypothetical protein